MVSKGRQDQILEAANKAFLRHGYRLTSMTQVAEEAGLSRQALYLVFPSKQELFNAVVELRYNVELEKIRVALSQATTTAEKLIAALDVWFVHAYSSTGAAELSQSTFEFANEATNKAAKDFETILATIIEPMLQGKPHATFTALELARLFTTASIGFKVTAAGTKDLKGSLRALVSAVLGSLGQIT